MLNVIGADNVVWQRRYRGW